MKWFKKNKTKKMVIEKCGVRTYETMCNNAHFIWIQKSIWLHCAHVTCLKMSQAFKFRQRVCTSGYYADKLLLVTRALWPYMYGNIFTSIPLSLLAITHMRC